MNMTLQLKDTNDGGLKIFGKPSANKAEGYLSFRDDEGIERLYRPSDFSEVRLGEALSKQLQSEFGLRAQNINCSFKVGDRRYYRNAPVFSIKRAFHLASQGYSVDMSPVMTHMDPKRPLPLPYPLYEPIEGKGIYIGLYEANRCLGQIFNVFAAPEDLPNGDGSYDFKNEEDMQNAIERLQNWHGHDGTRIDQYEPITADNMDQHAQWHLPFRIMDTYHERHLDPGLINLLRRDTPQTESRFYYMYTDSDGDITSYSTQENRSSYKYKSKNYRVRPIRLEPYQMPVNA